MKKLGLTLIIILFSTFSFGQVFESTGSGSSQGADTAKKIGVMDAIRPPVDGVYEKKHLPNYQPMALTPLREADVLYSNLTWRVIDLREKLNLPLYFPTETKGNWKSLMQAILDVTTDTSEANPNPIRVYSDEYLRTPYTVEGIRSSTGESFTQNLVNEWGEDTGQAVLFSAWGPREVYQYLIKEQYFIDKQRSVKEERIIGICPMFWYEPLNPSAEPEGDEMSSVTTRRWRNFGWLYFKEIRPMLAVTEVFNPQNNGQRRTYDDIFALRRFSSYVKGSENVYNNRGINEYIVNGMDQRLKSEEISNDLRKREHEMWEF
ncbi:MAG: gliding motility protein GldN [Bacteroidales bacterium]|jgi:gliding motility associated protien GldN|nr:gliding motility protein GldN [Bacteroidales bacterium]